ncbi:Uncharacterized conserved protein (DUF2203) [Chlamydia abortus]|uniref:DUF2203 domain-containing protein n=1 Tax=Paenibacillus residui TaxID=629724 RepID=A0ABW3DEZ8_9BACL|nr:DUF2203 domain-containing protein [Paenibacillus sp. 32O-W]SHE13107.1 Uncharacterized conserved protein (DUF2203) [Chlamydia abortus]
MKKWFTPEEANGLLPIIRQEVESLQEIKNRFERMYADLCHMKQTAPVSDSSGEDRYFLLESELEFLQMEAQLIANSIAHKGAELKDIELGLVDFPAVINGEEVLLCWKLGEDKINHYHGLDDGYFGRKRLDHN